MKLKKIRAGVSLVVNGVGYVALACLFAMVFIVALDVVLRKTSGGALRITGSNEITSFSMVILCSLAIPVLQIKNGHIWVPLFTNKFPYRFRCFWLFAIRLVETAVIALLAFGGYKKAADLIETGRLTDVLNMPQWIFAAVMTIAFVEYFVLTLIDTIQLFVDGVENVLPKAEDKTWSEEEVKGTYGLLRQRKRHKISKL